MDDLTEAWLGGWLLAFAVVSVERGDWLWGACVGLVGAYYTGRACALRRKQAQKEGSDGTA